MPPLTGTHSAGKVKPFRLPNLTPGVGSDLPYEARLSGCRGWDARFVTILRARGSCLLGYRRRDWRDKASLHGTSPIKATAAMMSIRRSLCLLVLQRGHVAWDTEAVALAWDSVARRPAPKMKTLSTCLVSGLLMASTVTSRVVGNNKLVPPPISDDRGLSRKRSTGQGVFQQLIDHSNPSLGTFSQSYWWSDEFYHGPGSPVIFFTPGEVDAAPYTGYLTNRTLTGLLAQSLGGAVVMMEHRYWGTSSPYDQLTTKNLQYLTLENSIKDTTYFARNVPLPFDANGTSHPSKAPWVFSGGSYSGALSAWTHAKDPGTFWAYHATSAVVETISDFWQYFAPVQQGLPKNCTSDLEKVIEYVDNILIHGSHKDRHQLKVKFGLGRIDHLDDFANVLENGPWTWQSHDVSGGYSAPFRFCDYVEVFSFPTLSSCLYTIGAPADDLCVERMAREQQHRPRT